MQCESITKGTRQCSRNASYLYLQRSGPKRWATLRGVCTQHYGRKGPERMLAPMPWEFDRIVQVDSRTGFVLQIVFDRENNPSGAFVRSR